MNNIVSRAAETFSDADLISRRIEQDEEWTLIPIHEILSFAYDPIIPTHQQGNKNPRLLRQLTLDKLPMLVQICMVMLNDSPPRIKDVVDLLKSHHITISDFESMLKMRMDKYKLSSKIKASLTSQYNDD